MRAILFHFRRYLSDSLGELPLTARCPLHCQVGMSLFGIARKRAWGLLSNIQKITCVILRNLFGLDLFSHQSCATGTLLLQKKIYPRKSSLNLKQLIFSCSLIWEMVVRHQSNFLPYTVESRCLLRTLEQGHNRRVGQRRLYGIKKEGDF